MRRNWFFFISVLTIIPANTSVAQAIWLTMCISSDRIFAKLIRKTHVPFRRVIWHLVILSITKPHKYGVTLFSDNIFERLRKLRVIGRHFWAVVLKRRHDDQQPLLVTVTITDKTMEYSFDYLLIHAISLRTTTLSVPRPSREPYKRMHACWLTLYTFRVEISTLICPPTHYERKLE